MKVVIMCAGRSLRFGGKPKWISEINGERNIDRTVRMVHEKGYKPVVTVFKTNLSHLAKVDCDVVLDKHNLDTQRFSNAFPLTEETIYLYGDVYYAQEDFDLIFEPVELTKFYGRKVANPLTHKFYGEFLGVRVVDFDYFMEAVNKTTDMFKKIQLVRCIGAEVYRVHEGLDPWKTDSYNDNFIILSDYTDDFDTREELEHIRKLHGQSI